MARAGAIATTRGYQGYLIIYLTKDGRQVNYRAHRVAWLLHTGEVPGDMQIDHIDGDPTNNRISNLRLVTHRENGINQRKHKNNTSGVMGLYWHKKAGKWAVQISEFGKIKYLGLFEDKWEAICARKSAENRFGYHENHGK